MGPLEALRRFQIDCGDLETPALAPKLPPLAIVPQPLFVEFPQTPPPTVGFPETTQVAELVPPDVPPLNDVPTTTTPVETVYVPSPVPEPGSVVLVLSGAAALAAASRRRSIS